MTSVHGENNPLGKSSEYIDQYDPTLLFPISRDESWKNTGMSRADIPFHGEDVWNGYEISWLNEKGKPMVGLAEFRLPATSPFLVESKSFKLYLNSYNQTRFANTQQVEQRMARDLSAAAGGAVTVRLLTMDHQFPKAPESRCIDDLDIAVDDYEINPENLRLEQDEAANVGAVVEESLVSHLLKSNCPVTGQPDWGSIFIEYKGSKIDEAGLLSYLVSLRQHQDFHEQCVERTFWDIWKRCQPEELTVYARYVRRGGLDINPFRTSVKGKQAENFRLIRQ